ncbi:MAG: hypothetical protein R2824_32520 [Saprospiraceae bacterium]|nr:hypothetical protein [Lewinella sp.]
MKKLILKIICLFFTLPIFCQIYFSDSDKHIGWLDLQSCEDEYFRNGDEFFPPRFESSTYKDIALAPDGRMFGITGFQSTQPCVLVEIDLLDKLNIDTLVAITGTDFCSSLVCDSSGVFYIGGTFIHSFNPKTGQLINYGRLPESYTLQGDLIFYEGQLLGSAFILGQEPKPSIWSINLDDISKSTKIFEFNDDVGFVGMTIYRDQVTKKKELIGANSPTLIEDEGPLTIFSGIDLDQQTQSILCELVIPIDYFLGSKREKITGLTSPDEFRQNYELRLDLDTDNSRGRLLDHFTIDTLCAVDFPIADYDISIVNEFDAIDSLTITIVSGIQHPGQEVLQITDHPLFLIKGAGSTELTIINQGEAQISDFISLLRQIRFQIQGSELMSGERQIDCRLYAGQSVSDIASAFIPIKTENEVYAGDDVSLEFCKNAGWRLLPFLGPDARTGGYWEPPLHNGTDLFYGPEDTAGVYRYIVQEGGCGADTAVVTISFRNEVPDVGYFPGMLDGETAICKGDTLVWSINTDELQEFGWEYTGPAIDPLLMDTPSTLLITQAGLYTLEFEDTYQCYSSASLYVVEQDGQIFTHEFRDTCLGAGIEWDGKVYYQDTMLCDTYTLPAACDSVHCIELQFFPEIEIRKKAVSCDEEPYDFYGQLLKEAGIYTKQLPSPLTCDTLVYLELKVGTSSAATIDTSIIIGDSIKIGNSQYLSEPGRHYIYLSNTQGCDSIVTLNLDIVSATHALLDNTYFLPTLIRSGQTFSLYNRSGSVEIIHSLEIYELNGRRVFQKSKFPNNDSGQGWKGKNDNGQLLPYGMYVYRIFLASGKSISGKVVLVE